MSQCWTEDTRSRGNGGVRPSVQEGAALRRHVIVIEEVVAVELAPRGRRLLVRFRSSLGAAERIGQDDTTQGAIPPSELVSSAQPMQPSSPQPAGLITPDISAGRGSKVSWGPTGLGRPTRRQAGEFRFLSDYQVDFIRSNFSGDRQRLLCP